MQSNQAGWAFNGSTCSLVYFSAGCHPLNLRPNYIDLSSLSHNGALHPTPPWVSHPIEQHISCATNPHHELGNNRTNNATSLQKIDRITTNSRHNSKARIKVSPLPLEPWPEATLSGHQPVPAKSHRAEALEAPSVVASTGTARACSPIQVVPTSPDYLLSPGDGVPLDRQAVESLASSCLRCTRAEDPEHSCHPCYEMRPVPNAHDTTHGPTDDHPSQFFRGDRHIIEQEISRAAGLPSKGPDLESGGHVLRSSEGASGGGTHPQQHPPATSNLHGATIVSQPSTFGGTPPLPEFVPYHGTRSSIRHIDAADAFLGIAQRNRQLDDSLERGIIGNQLEVETGLASWLDFNALGPRTKIAIAAVALGIVLLGAIVKLVQAIHPPTSTH